MWYESSLIATVIGTILGFTLAFAPAWVANKRQKHILHTLISEEIKRIVDYCKDRKVVYERYRNLVAEGGALGVYYSDRNMDLIYSSNRGDLIRLDIDYASKVADFYSHVADFKARALALSDSLKAHHSGEDLLTDKDFFVGSLDKLNETLSAIISKGEKLLGNDA
jgi:hypothetical protein